MTEKTKTRIIARIAMVKDASEAVNKDNDMKSYLCLSQEAWTLNSILIWEYSLDTATKELKIQNDTIRYFNSVFPKAINDNIDRVVLKNMREMYYEALGRQKAFIYYLDELNKEACDNELI